MLRRPLTRVQVDKRGSLIEQAVRLLTSEGGDITRWNLTTSHKEGFGGFLRMQFGRDQDTDAAARSLLEDLTQQGAVNGTQS